MQDRHPARPAEGTRGRSVGKEWAEGHSGEAGRKRPGDQTAASTREPGGDGISTSSDAGKRQQVSFPACAEPARTLGTGSWLLGMRRLSS